MRKWEMYCHTIIDYSHLRLQSPPFKFNLHVILLLLVDCVLLCHYVCHMCVSCNSTCVLLHTDDIFSLVNSRLRKSLFTYYHLYTVLQIIYSGSKTHQRNKTLPWPLSDFNPPFNVIMIMCPRTIFTSSPFSSGRRHFYAVSKMLRNITLQTSFNKTFLCKTSCHTSTRYEHASTKFSSAKHRVT